MMMKVLGVVLLPRLGATNSSTDLLGPLEAVSPAAVLAKQRRILDLIPRIVYARSPDLDDAVDTALRGLRTSRPDAFR